MLAVLSGRGQERWRAQQLEHLVRHFMATPLDGKWSPKRGRGPAHGKTVKRPPPVGRITSKCRRSRVAIVRVRYRPARTTFDASATPID